VRAFVKKSADNGVDVFRIFDAMNDLRNLRVSIEAVKSSGKIAEGRNPATPRAQYTISVTIVNLAKEFEAIGCDTLAIKDMAASSPPPPQRS